MSDQLDDDFLFGKHNSFDSLDAETSVESDQPEWGQHNLCYDEGKVHRIQPNRIGPSPFANRLPTSMKGGAFDALVADIKLNGGNTVPILVRPAQGVYGVDFEVVYGHRRHQACLILGLHVLAIIELRGTKDLQLDMHRENQHRKDLSPYEKGRSYLRMVQELRCSHKALADLLNANSSQVSRLIVLATLPDEVIRAFRSPNDLQVKWGTALRSALDKSPAEVLNLARSIANGKESRDAKAVYDRLTAVLRTPTCDLAPRVKEVWGGSQRKAVVTIPEPSTGHGIEIKLECGVLDPEVLIQTLQGLLGTDDRVQQT
jgi:ParB family chromosome partitioning protein